MTEPRCKGCYNRASYCLNVQEGWYPCCVCMRAYCGYCLLKTDYKCPSPNCGVSLGIKQPIIISDSESDTEVETDYPEDEYYFEYSDLEFGTQEFLDIGTE